jgi:hypothetical protein
MNAQKLFSICVFILLIRRPRTALSEQAPPPAAQYVGSKVLTNHFSISSLKSGPPLTARRHLWLGAWATKTQESMSAKVPIPTHLSTSRFSFAMARSAAKNNA